METSSETRAPNVIVIGIGGASGSGKSTLALNLEAALSISSEVRVLKMDKYFDHMKISRDLDNNWELPDSVDFQSYRNDTKEAIAQALSYDNSEKVPQDIARERRLSRVLAKNANHNPHQFRQWYDSIVWPHYEMNVEAQRLNVQGSDSIIEGARSKGRSLFLQGENDSQTLLDLVREQLLRNI